jgi:hypothetical protein
LGNVEQLRTGAKIAGILGLKHFELGPGRTGIATYEKLPAGLFALEMAVRLSQ